MYIYIYIYICTVATGNIEISPAVWRQGHDCSTWDNPGYSDIPVLSVAVPLEAGVFGE